MFVKTLMFQRSGNVFECKVLEKRVLKKELAREHSKDREVLRFLSLHLIQTLIVWQVNILYHQLVIFLIVSIRVMIGIQIG